MKEYKFTGRQPLSKSSGVNFRHGSYTEPKWVGKENQSFTMIILGEEQVPRSDTIWPINKVSQWSGTVPCKALQSAGFCLADSSQKAVPSFIWGTSWEAITGFIPKESKHLQTNIECKVRQHTFMVLWFKKRSILAFHTYCQRVYWDVIRRLFFNFQEEVWR